MKRKQKTPRRIRPVLETRDGLDKESLVSDSVCDITEAKRLRVEPDVAADNTCGLTDSSQWKWSISDFRKENLENLKEQLHSKDYNEDSSHSNERQDELNNASNSSKESSNSLKNSKECLKSVTDSSEISKKPVKASERNEESCKEYWGSLKHKLRNSPQVLPDQNQLFQNWKLPVRKELSNYATPPSELNRNTVRKNEKVQSNGSEETNMPVILNVFSLSKPRQMNTKQENTVLFTPPCSPPFLQLGPFSTTSVSHHNSRPPGRFINNQAAFRPGQENWYKPVQQVYQNHHEYFSNPLQQASSQNRPVKQVYYNYQEHLSNPVRHPKYKVYSDFQEMYPKPVQQAGSQKYLNEPVKQVYYTDYQENWTHPVQHVNSHEYINKPVQQVYYNPQYLSKQVQPVTSQEYQPTSSPEYLPNPVQKVNPDNPHDYVYNPVEHNPQQIANGVLPLEKQFTNQSRRERSNTVLLGYNYADSNEQKLAPRSTSSDSYLVENGNSVAKGNGMYARFKLKQPLALRQPAEIPPEFIQIPPIHDGSNVSTVNSETSMRQPLVLSNEPLTANTAPKHGTGSYTDKYRRDYGCSAMVDGHGKNKVVLKSSSSPTNNNNLYNVKQSEDSFDTPTMISEKQSVRSKKPFCTSAIYIPPFSDISGELRTTSSHEVLSPRDAKVMELKQRLEEQEATLKKLRATH